MLSLPSAASPGPVRPVTSWQALRHLTAQLLCGALLLQLSPPALGVPLPAEQAEQQDGVDAQRFRASPPRLPSSGTAETVAATTTPVKAGDLPLQEEFNLVSLPVEPASTAPAEVLAGAPAGTSAWTWDACAAEAAWKQYTPGDPANELTSIDHRYGLWLKAPAAGGWTLPAGEQPTVTEIPVCPGWNLIGYPLAQPRPVPAALSSIAGKYLRVFGYDAFDEKDPWEVYDPNVPEWANDLLQMQPGRGYWVLVTEATTLRFANHGPPPQIALTAPLDLDEITAPVDVTAQVDSDLLQSWELSYRPASLDEGEGWLPLAEGQTPTSGTLARFDPTLLPNDLYQLRLTATDYAEQSSEQVVSVAVEGGMKIGHFQLTFSDLRIPLSGLDLEVLRTYDSRDARLGRVGDFGPGWSMELRKGSVRHNRTPGEGWQIRAASLPCQQVVETQTHLTSVRLSDVEHYRFRLSLSLPATAAGGCFATAGFEYVDGPMSAQLEILDGTNVFYANETNHLVDADALEVYQPRQVRLVTRDGRRFDLDLAEGVTRIEDANGNGVDFSEAGILHTSALGAANGIDFERDAEGRINRIIDSTGRTLRYAYDATTGDLLTSTDPLDQTARYSYQPGHLLDAMEDPRGISPVRNEFDEDGRLVRHIDANGQVFAYEHDLDGRQEIVTDRLGHSRLLEFDERGNVVRQRDATGAETVSTFDARDNLLTERDPLGNTTSYTYSADNDLLSVTDPLGATTRFTYDASGRPLTVSDARGSTTALSYDAVGNLLSVQDPLGATTRYTYTNAGDLLTLTDPLGHKTSYTHDANGRLASVTDSEGITVSYQHDAAGNRSAERVTRTTPAGLEVVESRFVHDELNRLVETRLPDGAVLRSAYNALGQVIEEADPLGRKTSYVFDALGRLTTTSYADGLNEAQTYDAEGRVLTATDRAGRVTSYAYDPEGRLLLTTYPDGSTVQRSYDANGRLLTTTDERGSVTRFEYDAAGRRTAIIDPLGHRTTFGFDTAGNLTTVTDANGHTAQTTYDAAGLPIQVTHPDGTTTKTSYDALGRRLSMTDEVGRVTEFQYDSLGRLVAVVDALDQVTRYSFDELGDLVSQTDANGHVTRYEFDALGRQTARILPDGARETFAFDLAGNQVSRTDFAGRTTSFTFDALDQLLSRRYPDGSTVSFSYTPTGERASVTDGRGTTSYGHDVRDRLVQLTDPAGRRLSYGYDAAGLRTSMTAEAAGQTFTTSYGFDAAARMTSVTDPDGRAYQQSFDAVGNRTELQLPNGVTTTYQHDARNRLLDLVSTNAAGEVLQSYAYTLDATGNRVRIDEADGTTRAYDYDPVSRLTRETVTEADGVLIFRDGFEYDAVGNRTQRTHETTDGVEVVASTFDDRDRLLTEGDVTFTWDVNGNLVGQSGAAGATFSWDFDDRLVEVRLADGTTVRHGYDADGTRVATDGVEYLVDPASGLIQVVLELSADGERYYVRGTDLLAALDGSTTAFYLADGLGSIRGLSDEVGALTDVYVFASFGDLVHQSGSTRNPYLFAGEIRDAVTGLDYLRARWMVPGVGRFASMDPFAGLANEPMSRHRYLYALANPVRWTDPSGKFVGGVGELQVASTIRSIVSGIQADVGFLLIEGASNRGQLNIRDIILTMVTVGVATYALGKAIRLVKGLREKFGNQALRSLRRVSVNANSEFGDLLRTVKAGCPGGDCRDLTGAAINHLGYGEKVSLLPPSGLTLDTVPGLTEHRYGFHLAVLLPDGRVLDPLFERVFNSIQDFKLAIVGDSPVQVAVNGAIR